MKMKKMTPLFLTSMTVPVNRTPNPIMTTRTRPTITSKPKNTWTMSIEPKLKARTTMLKWQSSTSMSSELFTQL